MTNRTVLFHVGLPRAASTFLQRRVFPAFDAAFIDIRVHPKPNPQSILQRGSTAFLHASAEARAAIESCGVDAIVSSDSFIFGTPAEQLYDFDERAKCLQEIWPSAKILIVLRRQDDFCRSMYVTTLRKAYPYAPARLLGLDGTDHTTDHRFFPHTILNLDRIVAIYERRFGEKNVLVLPYELLKEDASKFIEAIMRFGNYRLEAEVTREVVNRGLSRTGYVAARILNWFCFANRQSGRHVLAWLESRSPASRFWRSVYCTLVAFIGVQHRWTYWITMQANRLSRQAPRPLAANEMKQILDYHAASNRALSARRNLELDRHGYF